MFMNMCSAVHVQFTNVCSGGVKKHRDCGERFTLGKEMASVRTVGAQRSGAEWEVKSHLRSSRKKVAAELKCLESEDLKFELALGA